ncbi:MAG: hypothetical protein AAF631_09800 [Pseudomonadota bacterium]
MSGAAFVIEAARWWLWAGAAVAAAFLAIGIDRVDEDARGAYAFRPLLVPAILLVWPLVLWRWGRLELGGGDWAARYRPPRAVHLPVALILAAALAFALVAGLAVRQTWPANVSPMQIAPPGTVEP